MSERRTELVRLLAELDQQLAEAEENFAEVAVSVSELNLRGEIVEGLRAAVENVELQLDRDRWSESPVGPTR